MSQQSTEPKRYRIEFVRIGRNHHVPPIEVVAADADEIAAAVSKVARKNLNSRFFEIDVDLEDGSGWIEGGRFGRFMVTDVTAEAATR
ncbi:hypothetical protein [Verrucosispora sp. NA02020]|uniref:hypothetical protein n=1 Tax=Verrucosispora sp. NA02020 TaxID=2742132 RepID=UPI003D73CEFE